MTEEQVNELEEIFSSPMKYYYYKDKFLVDRVLVKSRESNLISFEEIKNSFESKLLQKEWFVKQFLSKNGDAKICSNELACYWPENTLEFDITVSNWGEYAKKHQKDKWLQTSRGGYNLVLQINLSQEHFQLYNSWLKPIWRGVGIFNCTCHPINYKSITLGWVRLDLDFETNEVLIEEIQTDWLRGVNSLAKDLRTSKNEARQEILRNDGVGSCELDFWKYFNYMQSINKIWDELFISVAIWFAQNELQLSNIWMHSFDSCKLFKDQANSLPPQSLYTKLPKKMGFEISDENPEFLQKEIYLKRYFRKAKKEKVKWFKYN